MKLMRVFSRIFLWLGIAGIVAAVIVGFQPAWSVYIQYQQLAANRSAPFTNNLPQLGLAGVILWVAGFFVGLGIGMHRRKPATPTAKGNTSTPAAESSSD